MRTGKQETRQEPVRVHLKPAILGCLKQQQKKKRRGFRDPHQKAPKGRRGTVPSRGILEKCTSPCTMDVPPPMMGIWANKNRSPRF